MSQWPTRIGLLGCGAMGSAMAHGLARGGHRFLVSDVLPDAAAALAKALGAETGSAAEAGACDVVVLAVKPKDAADALQAVAPRAGTTVISVVAGWDLARLGAALGADTTVVRTMPNLAVGHGAGLVALTAAWPDEAHRTRVRSLLSPLGVIEELPEQQFAAATALVGSGPGFVALVAEGLEEGAVAVGFARPQARRMVQAVLSGTATLLDDEVDPAELRQRVSSPGGTTVEGVAVLERAAVRGSIADAVRAAARRAAEL